MNDKAPFSLAVSSPQSTKPENLKDDMVLGEIKVALALIKVVPWNAVWTRIKIFFSARMTIIGPEASGKSTLIRVLYNAGNLVAIQDHRRTQEIHGERALELTFTGPLGQTQLLLRSIWDTPGQRHDVAREVARHIASYTPRVLVFVLDMARPFRLTPDGAERDTEQWFNDLIAYTQGPDKEGFLQALKQVDCIVVMLNRINVVYDRLFDQLQYERPNEVDNRLEKEKDEYEEAAKQKIRALFASAGIYLQPDDITCIECCLVRYDGKRTEKFDTGHIKMLEVINQKLQLRR